MTDIRFSDRFTGPVIEGESLTLEVDGFTVTATIHRDDDMGAPWKEHDGHGTVSGWRAKDSKRPGEMVMKSDHGSCRFYDFEEACVIARRDGWAPSPYRLDTEEGSPSHGSVQVTGQWFHGRELVSFKSDWCDDKNEAVRQVYAMHRESITPRQLASLAALADFEWLRRWCDDEWHWIGVALQVSRGDVDLTGDYAAALWGIDSESPDHITETANELIGEALDVARKAMTGLNAA